jgi:hypothetical protein
MPATTRSDATTRTRHSRRCVCESCWSLRERQWRGDPPPLEPELRTILLADIAEHPDQWARALAPVLDLVLASSPASPAPVPAPRSRRLIALDQET